MPWIAVCAFLGGLVVGSSLGLVISGIFNAVSQYDDSFDEEAAFRVERVARG